jgi:CMP-N-acetylneuraminic acid synthetase
MVPLLPFSTDGVPWHSRQYQSLPEIYIQNGCIEIARSGVVAETGTIAGATIMPFLTEPPEGFDLNNEQDWHMAEEMIARGDAALPSVA